MASEVEIKFACDPGTLDAVLARLLGRPPRDRRLVSVYFDTPDRALAAAGASLRVRTDGSGRAVQTLKSGRGLSREEVERETPPGGPDLSWPELAGILEAPGLRALAPRFTVQVRRRSGETASGASRIEVAADEGEILAGGRRTPVCELELEILEGGRDDLFALALALVAEQPLFLSLRTKSARGADLAAGLDGSRPGPVSLSGDITAAEALRRGLLEALEDLAARLVETGVTEADRAPSVEAVHQLRVSLRRLRSLVSVFRSRLGPDRVAGVRPGLRSLARACAAVRDLDVLMALAPTGPSLEAALTAGRAKAAAALSDHLASAPARLLLVDLLRLAEDEGWRRDPHNLGPAAPSLGTDLDRRWRRIRKRARQADDLGDADLHALRLRIKAFRYALAALDVPAWRAPARDLERRLHAAQDALGAHNDASAAAGVLDGLDLYPAGREEARRFLARLSRRGGRRRALRALERLEGTRTPEFT